MQLVIFDLDTTKSSFHNNSYLNVQHASFFIMLIKSQNHKLTILNDIEFHFVALSRKEEDKGECTRFNFYYIVSKEAFNVLLPMYNIKEST